MFELLNELHETNTGVKHAFTISRKQDENLKKPFYVVVQAEDGKTYRKGFNDKDKALTIENKILKQKSFNPSIWERSSKDGTSSY